MHTPPDTGFVMVALLMLFAGAAILIVVLARWIFRINDIVNRLDNIVELMRKAQTPAPPDLRHVGSA